MDAVVLLSTTTVIDLWKLLALLEYPYFNNLLVRNLSLKIYCYRLIFQFLCSIYVLNLVGLVFFRDEANY